MKSVGIITWHHYPNFGSALQAFALQYSIEKLGYDAKIINYRNPKFGVPTQSTIILKTFLAKTLGRLPGKVGCRFKYASILFSYRYHKQTKLVYDTEALGRVSGCFDVIVCGGDQIWAPNVFNPIYMASFAGDDQRRISYAASIGLNEIPDSLVSQYRHHLMKLFSIGVRETTGELLLKNRCNLASTVVLDPTLLVSVAKYRKMERRVYNINKPFIFCYFLKENNDYEERVKAFAIKHNLQILGVSSREEDNSWLFLLSDLGADEFLWLVDNAEYVLTDSYHGTIFSLLFHKKFWSIERFNPDDPICQNSRILQLKEYFSIENQIVRSTDDIIDDFEYDFDIFEEQLSILREKSINYLSKSLLSC